MWSNIDTFEINVKRSEIHCICRIKSIGHCQLRHRVALNPRCRLRRAPIYQGVLLRRRCYWHTTLLLLLGDDCYDYYHQTSNISPPNPKTYMFPFSPCSCLCPIHWSRLLSRKWRCSWSSSNYIWVINSFMTYWGAAYIRCLRILLSGVFVDPI